jgi:transposase
MGCLLSDIAEDPGYSSYDQRGRITLERPPAYAPELNPVEYLWGYWKQHELPNRCPQDFAQLSPRARHALRRMRRRTTLV